MSAFVSSLPLALSTTTNSLLCPPSTNQFNRSLRLRPTLLSSPRLRSRVFATATPPSPSDTDPQPEADPAPTSDSTTDPDPDADPSQTSASKILKSLREDSEQDMLNKEDVNDRAARSMLGVYRDVDGRSNVWAVEPQEETDSRPQISKAVIIAFAGAFIVAVLLLLPILPFTNPDQA